MKRRVIDCFTFFNETSLLKLRFALLKDVVDLFVIVEGNRTFTGVPRQPEFRADDYDVPADKIRYVLVDDLLGLGCDAWENERRQRNAILRGLQDLRDSDLIHVSDVDEVPNPNVFDRYKMHWISAGLDQKLYYYQLNNLVLHGPSGGPVICSGAKITTGRHLRCVWGTPENLRRRTLMKKSLWNRVMFRLRGAVLGNAGWHWSYMMDPQQISQKKLSFSHTEFSGPECSSTAAVQKRIDAGVDPFDRDYRLQRVVLADEYGESLANLIQKHCAAYVLDSL